MENFLATSQLLTPLFPLSLSLDESHSAQPHPCAPQSVIDQYFADAPKPSNPQTSPSAQNSSSYGGPVDPSQQGKEQQADTQKSSGGGGGSGGSGGGSGGSSAIEEWEMPSRLKRNRYAPTETEIDAIQVSSHSPDLLPKAVADGRVSHCSLEERRNLLRLRGKLS